MLVELRRNKKWLSLQSPALVAAYRKVNKRPQLRKHDKAETITEMEPFPVLFYHLEDIGSEITTSGDESARSDFQALQFVCKEFEDRWADARQEQFEDGFCSYGTLWKLFRPGDLVIRKDELGNEWFLVFVSLEEYKELRPEPQPPNEYMMFTTWGLRMEPISSVLERIVFRFRLHPFLHRQKMTSLPVYPLGQKGVQQDAFLKAVAKRGRKWQALIKPSIPLVSACHFFG